MADRPWIAAKPTLLFLVRGVPGKAYEPPVWSRDWRPRGVSDM